MEDNVIDAPDERLEDVEAGQGKAPNGAEYLNMPGWVVTEKAETSTYKRTQWARNGVSAYHYGDCIDFRFWWSHPGGTYGAACRAQDFARVFGGKPYEESGQGGRSPRGDRRAGEAESVEWPPTRVRITLDR